MPKRKSSAEEKGGEEEMEDEGKEPESAVEGAGLLATADDSTEKSDNTEPHCRRKADEPSTQIDFLAPGPTALPSVHLPPTAALPSEVKLLRHYGYYCDSRKLNRCSKLCVASWCVCAAGS